MVITMIFNSRGKITSVFENKEKIKVDVGIVARSGATWKKAIFFGCISGNAAWRYEKSSLHHSCTYTSGEEGSTSSIRPDNSLRKTMVQVGTSVGGEGKDTREKREREGERERLHGFLWTKNWNNGNWLTSNEYSIGLSTLEQGNERKILEELHWCALIRQDNEKCVRNLRHTTLSYSLGGSHRNGW